MSKKTLIIEQAGILFSQQSIQGTSIEDITKACGISKGAFYLHFKSKDDLLTHLFDYYFKEIVNRFSDLEASNLPPRQKLQNYFALSFTILEEKMPFISMYTQQQWSLNASIIEQFDYYNKLVEQTTTTILLQVYGDTILPFLMDLLVTLKGLVNGYAHHMLCHRQPYDFARLAHVLSARLDLIVEHTTEWYIDEQPKKLTIDAIITPDLISKEIKQILAHEQFDDFYEESLQLLLKQFEQSTPSEVIVKGMLANIQHNEHLNWIAFLVRNGTWHN